MEKSEVIKSQLLTKKLESLYKKEDQLIKQRRSLYSKLVKDYNSKISEIIKSHFGDTSFKANVYFPSFNINFKIGKITITLTIDNKNRIILDSDFSPLEDNILSNSELFINVGMFIKLIKEKKTNFEIRFFKFKKRILF